MHDKVITTQGMVSVPLYDKVGGEVIGSITVARHIVPILNIKAIVADYVAYRHGQPHELVSAHLVRAEKGTSPEPTVNVIPERTPSFTSIDRQ